MATNKKITKMEVIFTIGVILLACTVVKIITKCNLFPTIWIAIPGIISFIAGGIFEIKKMREEALNP